VILSGMPTRKPQALKSMGEPETVESLVVLFRELPDPRIDRTKAYPLDELLLLVLCGVVSGANHVTEIAGFGEAKLDWLRTILPYANGVPSHDTIGRVLGQLDPNALEAMFRQWMTDVAATLVGVVAVDGKTLRRAIRRGESRAFVHMVSAFSAANGLVYGQVKTDEKSNEITAIPELLKHLCLSGAIVTIDAAGCQENIIKQIVEQGGDFVIGVKANQPTLQEDIDVAFHSVDLDSESNFASTYEVEKPAHGRGEWRRCEVLPAINALTHAEKWEPVKSIIRVTSERILGDKKTLDSRYYISSIEDLNAAKALDMVRNHWAVENRLHWNLDVSFREDECRVYAKNASENLVVVRHIALNLLRSVKSVKGGIGARRMQSAYSDAIRMKVLCAGLN